MTDTKRPAFDPSALTFEDAERPTVQRKRQTKDNPFTPLLAETYENKTAKSVTVPTANVGQVKYLIRAASNELGIGSTLNVTDDKPRKGQSVVVFAGKDRKAARKDKNAAAPTA